MTDGRISTATSESPKNRSRRSVTTWVDAVNELGEERHGAAPFVGRRERCTLPGDPHIWRDLQIRCTL
jgi:hypothetical protein